MDDLTVSVAENGRVVLPQALRRRLNVLRGGTIIIREEGWRLMLERADDGILRAQSIVRRFAPGAVEVVDELLDDRRTEAAREDS